MTTTDERMDRFDARLDEMGEDVSVLKADVSVLKADVSVLKADVSVLKADVRVLKEDVGALKDETRKLRILSEEQSSQIKLIAEVQVAHGEKLEKQGELLLAIQKDLAPVSDFVRRVASEHGARLDALEKHTGLSREP